MGVDQAGQQRAAAIVEHGGVRRDEAPERLVSERLTPEHPRDAALVHEQDSIQDGRRPGAVDQPVRPDQHRPGAVTPHHSDSAAAPRYSKPPPE